MQGRVVSIHAPREGRDRPAAQGANGRLAFQSTRPVKGATCERRIGRAIGRVSIHAPREGRDCGQPQALDGGHCFNPRAP